ncbi:MAG: YcbK family protein [Alphaproteobacteria bacterium]|nr:YcbK family protein [Alphaproteobacteria bacterium]
MKSTISKSCPVSTVGLDRRKLLLGGVAGICAISPLPALAAIPRHEARTLSFLNLHTGEKLTSTYWERGDYVAESVGAINHLLRDFRSGEVKPIDAKLFDVLHSLQGVMESSEPFHVISGYRSPTTNNKLIAAGRGVAKRSLHMRGMAVDVRLPGRELRAVYRAARAMQAGGVGYYEKSNFVHIDTGRVRYW